MECGIVGPTRIEAYSDLLTDPALPEGAQRKLLCGDVHADIPRSVVTLREPIGNLKDATASDSTLSSTLGNVRTLSDGFGKPGGVVGALLGDHANRERLGSVLERTDARPARANRLLHQAGAQVLVKNGLTREAQATVSQLNKTLQSTQRSLARVDSVLKEAQGIAANTRGATEDLSPLCGEVESRLHNLDRRVNVTCGCRFRPNRGCACHAATPTTPTRHRVPVLDFAVVIVDGRLRQHRAHTALESRGNERLGALCRSMAERQAVNRAGRVGAGARMRLTHRPGRSGRPHRADALRASPRW